MLLSGARAGSRNQSQSRLDRLHNTARPGSDEFGSATMLRLLTREIDVSLIHLKAW